MTNTTKKTTKREYFNQLKELDVVKANEELVAFIDHEIELLDKKNSSEKKPTKEQKANEELKTMILDTMEVDTIYSPTELIKQFDVEMSTQKVTALLRQLIDNGKVEKVVDKRKSFYKLV